MGNLGIPRKALGTVLIFTACSSAPDLSIEFEKYTLENGLEVVLHEDRSDPITAIAVLYHVGSNREEVGRTGFAHLFEHMMFQSSQHVGEDQFFQKIQGSGGTLNGGTSFDQTIYYEVVPNNALEMALWLESDRMGFLLSTVTEEAFVNQQEVVQNEKRQRVDNQPYGHTNYVLHKMLYPEAHPYNWQVIGSLEDLQNATVEDVRDFFRKWYGPNNATLAIAGDFDREQVKAWVEKYFGEIKSGPPVPNTTPQPVALSEIRRSHHVDNFARSPELTLAYPTVETFNEDAYPLQMLGQLLASGKDAPLYKTIVEDEKLAPSVSAFQQSLEVAGNFRVRVRAFPSVDLDQVQAAVATGFERFEQEGFTSQDLDRIKAGVETAFYNGISSVLGKSFQLARYNEYAGSPGYVTEDLAKILAVTEADVWRVYEQYIKGRPYVQTSFVPRGGAQLMAGESEAFPVVEEAIRPMQAPTMALSSEGVAPVEPIPSSFDRSIEPPKGPVPDVTVPAVWSNQLSNGMKVYGARHAELPLVQFSLTFRGGHLLDDPAKPGVANLISDIMMEGTANKTPLELEQAIETLGASIFMFTNDEAVVLQVSSLASKLGDVYDLVEEILMEPRWDATEFARIKQQTIENIRRSQANPAAIASNVFRRLMYGDDHVLSTASVGTVESVESITLDDVKNFYQANFSPSVTYAAVVGDITQAEAVAMFKPLEGRWPARTVEIPTYSTPEDGIQPRLYFVDVPGAKQSEIRIGYLGLAETDPDYYPATVMNYKLGGSFNGRVNLILREEKGYTYGARSGFNGSSVRGPFVASAAVRSNATYESVEIFRDEFVKYREGVSSDDLQFTKDALIQSNALRFETLGALRGMVSQIAEYGWPVDYVKRDEDIVRNFTLDRHQSLAQQYIDPTKMVYLVVGDADTQLARLSGLGLGRPIMLNVNGDMVSRGDR